MSLEQRQGLTQMLAAHLCDDPSALDQLVWVPTKLRDKALQQLTFTIRRIGGIGIHDASLEYFSGCKFISVAHLKTRQEQWLFQSVDGKNIPVFGVDEIHSIAGDEHNCRE